MAQQTTSSQLLPHLIDLRRSIHTEPELAFTEKKTAQKIITELEQLNIPYEYDGEGSGVVGKLITDNNAPTVALRAEMDGLPGVEETGLPFASKHEGCMHACGHDAHMTMVLGAAHLLAAKPPLGNVLFVFQPAEERGAGAREIIKTGVLKDTRAIFAAHVTHHYRVGEIMIGRGVITAQSDRFLINIQGKGGHGARPHEAIDAVVITGLLITAIQTLVAREIDPVHPSVVTIGKVTAGSASNVIAASAELEGSIRTTRDDVRQHIHHGIKRIANAVASLHNAKIDTQIFHGNPPVVNTDRETDIARDAAQQVVGEQGIKIMEHPSMGSEDFSFYLKEIPGCYVRFGARISEENFIPLHSPCFDVNEAVLPIGADFFNTVARKAIAYYTDKR